MLAEVAANATAALAEARARARRMLTALNPRERLFLVVGVGVLVVFMMLLAIFHEPIIHWMAGFSERFRTVPFGWFIILLLLFVVSFPPLIGYSVLSMFTGMVYGFPHGWALLAAGTLFGSFLCFVVFRHFFAARAKTIAQSNIKIMAFAKTLEQDSLVLLWMIRLCPLPYSLSNAAMSSVHTVTATKFFIATALTTPKLLLHIFIGDRLARLGSDKGKDPGTKLVNFLSIVIALVVGVATSVIIYRRTTERAAALEAARGRGEFSGGAELDEFEIEDEALSPRSSGDDGLENARSHSAILG